MEVVNLLFNNRWMFAIARYLRLFDAVFVMYPAGYEFADHFTFRMRQKSITWSPFIVGIIKHPRGERTLMFAISAFVDGKDGAFEGEMLRALHERTDVIRRHIGAASTHFAGTLPGKFSTLKIRRGDNQKNERRATQENVLSAVRLLRVKLGHDHLNAVVVIGSNGFIGKGVTEQLEEEGIVVISVDKSNPPEQRNYRKPDTPHVVLNITGPEAINEYVTGLHMGVGTTVLNEAYPAPHPDVVQQMHELGAAVFHIAGVSAKTLPSFPSSYEGAVPCCAALPGVQYEIQLVKL